MSVRWVFQLVSSLMLAAVWVTPVAAQQAPAGPPRADVFAGLGVWHEDGRRFEAFQITGGYRPWRYVSFIGDVAFYGEQRTTLMGGVRVQGRGRVAPFAQVLYGSAPLDDIAIQPGAGVDFRVSRYAAIRGAFDFKISGDDGSTYTGSRVSIGIVLLIPGTPD